MRARPGRGRCGAHHTDPRTATFLRTWPFAEQGPCSFGYFRSPSGAVFDEPTATLPHLASDGSGPATGRGPGRRRAHASRGGLLRCPAGTPRTPGGGSEFPATLQATGASYPPFRVAPRLETDRLGGLSGVRRRRVCTLSLCKWVCAPISGAQGRPRDQQGRASTDAISISSEGWV